MTADPKCCLPEDTIARAAEVMREEDVGPVPIVSDRKLKRLAGIVTDRDIAIKVVAAGRDPKSTRVDEVMSADMITCQAEDDYNQALQVMARHQLRRIPIVNEDGVLLGIISQADVARRTSEDELGKVVEEISEPAGLGHSLGSLRSHSSRADESENAFGPNILLMGAACLSAGAGLMYLLDPNRGRSRRAIVRGKATSLYNDSTNYAGKLQRDLRNRATGVAATAKAKLTHEDEVADQIVEARVRTKLGRITSHPRAIRVRAENGCVILEGNILANEINRLVSAVRSVPGVTDLENRLQTHEKAGNIAALQGDTERPRERSEFLQVNWSPTARLIASALGGGLVIYGLRAHGPLAKATATVGVGLLARGISNKEVASWTDLGAARPVLGL